MEIRQPDFEQYIKRENMNKIKSLTVNKNTTYKNL